MNSPSNRSLNCPMWMPDVGVATDQARDKVRLILRRTSFKIETRPWTSRAQGRAPDRRPPTSSAYGKMAPVKDATHWCPFAVPYF